MLPVCAVAHLCSGVCDAGKRLASGNRRKAPAAPTEQLQVCLVSCAVVRTRLIRIHQDQLRPNLILAQQGRDE